MNFAVDSQLRGENGVLCGQDFLAKSANTCNFILQKMKIKAPRGGLGERRNLLIFLRDKRIRRAAAGMAFAMLKQARNPVEGKRIAVSVPGQTGFPSVRLILLLALCLGLLGFIGCGGSPTTSTHTGGGDFNIAVSPVTVTAMAGSSSAGFTVSATGQNGFSGAATVALSGLPGGTTTSPASPFSLTAGGSQKVTLTLPATASNGNYTVTATGSAGSLSHSSALTLTINAAPDFSIALSPNTITAAAGTSNTTFTASITAQNGFNGSTLVTLSGLPTGATTSPASPFNLAAGSSETLTLSLPTTVAAGNYTITATGNSGSLSHSSALTLTINAAPDFSVALSPNAITAAAGTSNTPFTASITAQNGFNGATLVTLSGLPTGATTSPASPFNLAAGSSQTLTLSLPTTVAAGNYTITATGNSGSLTHSTALTLTVGTAPAFSMALSPAAIVVNAGMSNANLTVLISGENGFSGSVAVALSGLPAGTTTFPGSPFNISAGSTQTVNLSVPSTATTGDYTVTATGNAGTLAQSATLPLTVTPPLQSTVTTWHYDVARTSVNAAETTLTPANVNTTTFGKIATFPVDGFLTAQPLYMGGVNIAGQGVHDVVYVATMHDSVYAFDADSTNTTPLWMTSILNYSPAGATSVPSSVQKNANTTGWSEIGIVSTPVIDPATGIMYLVAETYENGSVIHRLHALDVSSGEETLGGPVTIAASYTLNGGTTTFKSLYQLNRPALLLANGHIYIGFGSNCCNDTPSQGWMLSYNEATLQQEGAFTTEPAQNLASIWMKGAGPAADSSGNIYAETGEGPFVAGTNFAISVLKFTQNGTSLGLTDWFTPYNYQFLAQNDKDLSNGVLILPDQPGTYPHELIAIGKEGSIYLLNRDNMGQLCTACTTTDTQIVQEVPQGAGKLSGTPVYWNNTVYVTGQSIPVYGYSLQNGTLVTPPSLQSAQAMGGGGNSILTANGTSNGILWFTSAGANLYALNASNLQLLWVSTQAANSRDAVGPLPHFATPISVDGKVFLGTQSSLLVYGLL